jgi:hypothetical protein
MGLAQGDLTVHNIGWRSLKSSPDAAKRNPGTPYEV